MSAALDPHHPGDHGHAAHAGHVGHAGDGHHEHPSWLAHHFESAEQQHDAAKLGMWLFLVTEVLFFSGMFCAYALYRSLHPEIFEFASAYLNKFLGAINTGVLLFSSLTMAWAVRAAQLRQHRLLVGMLAATLSCAAIFLGVKAVEYTHKWDLGLMWAGSYVSQLPGAEHHSNYLWYFYPIPGIILIGAAIWWASALLTRNPFQRRVAGPIFVAAACFFGGIELGQVLTAGEEHAEHKMAEARMMVAEADMNVGGSGEAMTGGTMTETDELLAEGHAEVDQHTSTDEHGLDVITPAEADLVTARAYVPQAHPNDVAVDPATSEIPNAVVNQKSMAGIFFSIYYAMTGIHAVHILGGMIVITWLIVKAAREEFHAQYFGPVDNVGLYWHLVDFIWIYLFPLLYLIT